VARTTPVYTPLSAKKHLVIWGLAALPGVTLFTLPFERLFDFVRMETDRASALQAAEQYLFQRGVDPSSYERVATLTTVEEGDGLPVRYLRQRLGVTGVNEAYRSRLIPAAWNTRFFKPLQKEEYRILVHMDGRVVRYDHRLDEAAPGDTLTPEAAREIAEREIAGAWDMTGYTLVETTAERRVGRIDHTFTWEDTLRRVGAGHFRIQAEVQGAETVRIRPHFKPPEAWVREEQRTTAADTARRAVTLFVGALIIGLAFRLYIPWILQRRVNWRFAVIAAAIYTGLSALTRILNLTDFYAAYDTSVSLSTYMATMSVVFLMGNLIFPMFTLLVLFSFVETGYRQAFPDKTDLTAWFRGMARSQHGETRSVWRDAMALSFAACLLGPGVRRVMQATSHYLGVPTQTSLEALSFASSVLPVASGLLEAITDAMLFGGLLLWGVIMARHYLPGTGALFGVMAVLAMAMTAGGADTWTEFGVKSGQLLFQFALLFMGVRYLWRDNLTACALTIFLLSLTGHAWDTLLYAPRTYGVSGIILLILALASPFILRRSVRSRKSASLPA
jgi:hypothetical protein